MSEFTNWLSLTSPVAIVGVIASLVITKRQADEAETVNKKQWDEIDKLRNSIVASEKETAGIRLELELKISKLDGNYEKLSQKLESIDKKIDDLITSVRHRKDE